MVYVKKNKQKIKYICPNCLKDFGNHLYHYNQHINRVNPCKKKNSNNDENDINNDNSNDLNDNLNDKNIILNGGDNNDLIFELMKKMNLIINQNEKLKNELEKLKKTPKNTIINNNYIQVNNFNDTKDFKGNYKFLTNFKYIDKNSNQIYLKPIENVYLNPEKPENHNFYVADKNRKIIKVYNNNRWKSENFDVIDEIINIIVDYYRISIDTIKNEKPEIYENLKNNISNNLKYINYCDLDFLQDLIEEQINDGVNNKKEINKCRNYRKKIYDEIINLLNDKKDIVINTHKKRKNDIIDI